MQRILIKNLKENVGKEVSIAGWVDNRRDHGKLIFIDLRDTSGKVQMVALPNHKEAHETAGALRSEWVISACGMVNKRPEKMVNKDEENGEIEIEIFGIEVLNKSETPPFEITETKNINEDVRLEYRYLDLRTERMQRNIRKRHQSVKFIRDYLDKEGFAEIETPILTKSTPEGARDFIVPSRLEKGHFYALPQSPQQYKQLLMVAGFEKYFQMAKCMRDEDTRGDRQPEFTQLDLEMSFVEREDVMALNEALLIELVKEVWPEKRIQSIPFPRISYKEAIEKYGVDNPDLRENKEDPNLLAFCWVIDFPFFSSEDGKKWTFTHNPFSMPKSEDLPKLMEKKDLGDILTTQYDIALNGFEIGGGSIRAHKPEILEKVFEIMGHKKEDIKNNFGHMLTALSYGAPPHGGIAWGLDRLIAILRNEPNIREVIAFAKTGEGRDLMMQAPSEIDKKQLDELGIKIVKGKE